MEKITVDGQEVSPPVGAANTSGVVVVLNGLSERSTVRVRYTVSVAANATTGEMYTIRGDFTDNGTSTIASTDVTVEEGSPLKGASGQYDADYDGTISIAELGAAAADYANEDLQIAGLGGVAAAHATS